MLQCLDINHDIRKGPIMVEKVAVLGAGLMGAGIAQVAAQAGYSVILRDLQMSLVKDGLQSIGNNLDKMVNRKQIDKVRKDEIMNRIHGTTDLSELHQADLVIEAVVENMAVKKQIFAELDNICPAHTVLATNTSSLSISEIAASTGRQGKIMGMHFLNPVVDSRLVELVRGLETSEDTVAIAAKFITAIGKDYVVIKRESPGYIVNRILIPYINEAIFIYGDGIATRDEIDLAMKMGAGMREGPLELADSIGLDTIYFALEVFFNEFRDSKYRSHPLFSAMIRAGYYGKKSGHGFYKY